MIATHQNQHAVQFNQSQLQLFVKLLVISRFLETYAAVAGIRQTKASEELYFRLKEELGTGVIVEHKKYGEGVVTQLDDRLVHIMFQDDTLRMMDLKILANAGLLKVKK